MASEMFIGIDVASRELVVSSHQGLTVIANTQAAIEAWLMGLPAGSHIGVESTGYAALSACRRRAPAIGLVAAAPGRRGQTPPSLAQMTKPWRRWTRYWRRLTNNRMPLLNSQGTLANSDVAVAFVGLVPPQGVCDSGQKSGRRRPSRHGSAELRRLLYNCSQTTVRTLAWKSYYTQLKSGEFSTTQALVIAARKLLRIAFSLWQQPGVQLNAQKMACLGSVS
jgi:Transposase IS116/IS110/IS902 family